VRDCPVHEAHDEQSWQHECARLLEHHEPCFIEILSDSSLDIFKGCWVSVIHHSLNNCVALVELELHFFSESEKSDEHESKHDTKTSHLPSLFVHSDVLLDNASCELVNEEKADQDWSEEVGVK